MFNFDEVTNIFDYLKEQNEVLEHIYKYFDEFSKSNNLSFDLEKTKDKVTLTLTTDNSMLEARQEGIGNIAFRSYNNSIDLTSGKLYGFIVWSNKEYFESGAGKATNFTNKVLRGILEDFIK